MKRLFKFFGQNKTFSLDLGIPIGPTVGGTYNNLSYQRSYPTYDSVNFMFEWVNQQEYREFPHVRLLTFYGNIVDFSRWFDFIKANLPPNDYLPIYPPIYQIRTSYGNLNYMNGNVHLMRHQQIVEIDIKIYGR